MYAALFVFAVSLAFTDPNPFLAALEVFAFGAGGVRRFLALASVSRTSILKHRSKRLAVVGIHRLGREVRIDYGWLA